MELRQSIETDATEEKRLAEKAKSNRESRLAMQEQAKLHEAHESEPLDETTLNTRLIHQASDPALLDETQYTQQATPEKIIEELIPESDL